MNNNTLFLIPKEILGIQDFDLLYNPDTDSFVKDYGGNNSSNHNRTIVNINSISMKEIIELCSVKDFPKSFPVSERFNKIYSDSLNLSAEEKKNIPWFMCLPNDAYKKEIKTYSDNIKSSLKKIDLGYYLNIFKPTEPLLNQYCFPAKVDYKKFSEYLIHQGNMSNAHLQSFIPVNNGYAEQVVYSRTKTITGRLTITKGPNILLLPKKFRNIIVSRHGDKGKILYLDFKSLEPRVLLGHTNPNSKALQSSDLYQALVSDTAFVNKNIPRSVIKFIIIEKLYGATDSTIINFLLKEHPQLSKYDCKELIEYLETEFDTETWKRNLLEELELNNFEYIENLYGRHIKCEDAKSYKLLNYFVQSTAVDIALLGFQRIVDWIVANNLLEQITPIFVLHDALLLDLHQDAENKHLNTLLDIGSEAPLNIDSKVKFFLDSSSLDFGE